MKHTDLGKITILGVLISVHYAEYTNDYQIVCMYATIKGSKILSSEYLGSDVSHRDGDEIGVSTGMIGSFAAAKSFFIQRDLAKTMMTDAISRCQKALNCPAELAMKHMKKSELKLSDKKGNDFAILVKAKHAARKAGWTERQIADFREEAISKDHDHLLCVCNKYFDVC